MQSFTQVARNFFYRGRRAWMKRSSVWMLSYGLFTVGDLITLGAAIYLFQQGSITLGTALLFFTYMLMLEEPSRADYAADAGITKSRGGHRAD